MSAHSVKFELRTISAKRVAIVEADNIESVFEMDRRLILVTKDGKEYKFDHMEYVHDESVV